VVFLLGREPEYASIECTVGVRRGVSIFFHGEIFEEGEQNATAEPGKTQ
jgi:hypothetical protein